jgi:predicted porin
MKKSLIALAVAAAVPALAQAQTNVTMYGIVDAAVQYTKADGALAGSGTRLSLVNSGYNSSRWGVRGSEDLGGGLKANFTLESSLNNDDSTGFSFNNARRSIVGVSGGFGEIRLGREYTPYFWNHTVYDVFGTNGIGGQNSIGSFSLMPTTAVRANNSLTYVLPSGMPVFGQVMYALGEQTSAANLNKNQGNALGARFGAAFGPAEVAVGFGQENGAGSAKFTDVNVGAKVAFGPVSVMGLYDTSKDNAVGATKRNTANLGVAYAIGAGTIKGSFTTTKQTTAGVTTANASQIAVGYHHDLSKRTAVYTTLAIADNKAGFANRTLAGRTITAAGGKTSGLEFGLRHSF